MRKSELRALIRETKFKPAREITIQMKLPVVIGAADYHMFSDYAEALSKVSGKKIKFRELNMDEDEGDVDPRTKKIRQPYAAEFYI